MFYYKFKEVNNNIDYKIKKIGNVQEFSKDIDNELNNLGLIQHFTKELNNIDLLNCLLKFENCNRNLIVFDSTSVKYNIPNLVKNAIYKYSNDVSNDINVLLIKDSVGKNYNNSIIININYSIKEKDFLFEIKNQQSIIVDLKNLLNPYTYNILNKYSRKISGFEYQSYEMETSTRY